MTEDTEALDRLGHSRDTVFIGRSLDQNQILLLLCKNVSIFYDSLAT